MPEAPKRQAAIEKIIEPYAYLWDDTLIWGPGWENYENRVRTLLPLVCEKLNEIDRGYWEVLHKMDRGPEGVGYVPYDVIVWTQTNEHFDIFTDDARARWTRNGVFTDKDWSSLDARMAVRKKLIPPMIPMNPGRIGGGPEPVPLPRPEPVSPSPLPLEPNLIHALISRFDEAHADALEIVRTNAEIMMRLTDIETKLEQGIPVALTDADADRIRTIIDDTVNGIEFVGKNRYFEEFVVTPRKRG